MYILGAIGLGMVWGWLAARWMFRARWTQILFTIIGSGAQLGWLWSWVGPETLVWFIGATLGMGVVSLIWLRTLEQQSEHQAKRAMRTV